MHGIANDDLIAQVALLAEGVDRNDIDFRADLNAPNVALLAEGVDRNIDFITKTCHRRCRPPRGGRG